MDVENLIKEVHKYKGKLSASDYETILKILSSYKTDEQNAVKEERNKISFEDEIKNLEIAETLKQEGKVLFQKQKFEEAIEKYTQAIELDPLNKVLYSNRSACYAKLSRDTEGIQDAKKAIELDPTYSKAYARLGAFFYYTSPEESLLNYEKALENDKGNQEYKRSINNLKKQIQKDQNPEPLNPKDFDMASMLNNPEMLKYAQEFLKNKSPEEIEQMKTMFQGMMGKDDSK